MGTPSEITLENPPVTGHKGVSLEIGGVRAINTFNGNIASASQDFTIRLWGLQGGNWIALFSLTPDQHRVPSAVTFIAPGIMLNAFEYGHSYWSYEAPAGSGRWCSEQSFLRNFD